MQAVDKWSFALDDVEMGLCTERCSGGARRWRECGWVRPVHRGVITAQVCSPLLHKLCTATGGVPELKVTENFFSAWNAAGSAW